MCTHQLHLLFLVLLFALPSSAVAQWSTGPDGVYYTGGNVGIGTSTPQAALDVNGSMLKPRTGTYAYKTSLHPDEVLRVAGPQSDFVMAVQDGTGRVQQYWNATAGPSPTYMVSNEAAGKIQFSPNGGALWEVMRAPEGTAGGAITWQSQFYVGNYGRVGIGTNTPDTDLHVKGDLKLDGARYNRLKIVSDDYWAGIELRALAKTEGGYPHIDFSNGPESEVNYGMRMYAKSNDRLIVDGGSVGIGVTSFSTEYKLAVDGTVGAKEVVVTQNGWADYVFEDDYPLLPLSEVDAFIQANGHLPDVPTADEVAKSGAAVGETQVMLLEKWRS